MTIGICALCGKQAELRQSHILPKFAVRWLKETSATGYLRDAISPNIRRQDIRKTPLLCAECEERLSAFETRFAGDFFRHVQQGNFQRAAYGPWMLKFCVSVSWRSLRVHAEEFLTTAPQFAKVVNDALQCWSEFLLDRRANITPYEQHVFVLDYPEALPEDAPSGFIFYLLRSIDTTLGFTDRRLFVYSKLLRVVILAPLRPLHPAGLERTRVFAGEGALLAPQTIAMWAFSDFLLGRAKEAMEKSRPSEAQRRRIAEDTLRNPERVLRSETMAAKLAERKLRQ